MHLHIANDTDWIVYSTTFADGEYGFAITKAFDTAPDAATLHIVDLGANGGFFTPRVADLLHRG